MTKTPPIMEPARLLMMNLGVSTATRSKYWRRGHDHGNDRHVREESPAGEIVSKQEKRGGKTNDSFFLTT